MADDAKKTFIDDYAAEQQANAPQGAAQPSEADILAEIDKMIAEDTASEQASAAAPSADRGAAPGPDGAAPAEAATTPDPNLIPSVPLAPDSGIGTARDIRNSMVRGPIKGMANAVDFGARALDASLEYLGVAPDTFSSGTATGDLVDRLMGQPETTAGAVTQDVASYLVPMKAVLGTMEYASKAQKIAAGIVGSSLLETALTSDKAGGLSNMAQEQADNHWSNNWLTEMLALEKDDNGFQKFTKRTIENMIVNKVFDKAATVIGAGWTKLRGVKKDVDAIQGTAAEAGHPTSPKVEQALKEAAVAGHEAEVVEAVAQEIKPPAAKTLTGEHAELAVSHEAAKNTLEDVSTSITAAETSLKSATTAAEKKALKAHLKELTGQQAALKEEIASIEGRLDPKFVERVAELEALDGAVTQLTKEAETLRQQIGATEGLKKGPLAKRLKKIEGQLAAAEADRAALKGQQAVPVEAAPAAPAGAPAAAPDDALRLQLRDLQKQLGEAADDATANALRTQISDIKVKIGQALQQAPASPAATPGAPEGAAAAAPEAPTLPVELRSGVEKKTVATIDAAIDRAENLTKTMEELGPEFGPDYLKGLKDSAVEGGVRFAPEQVARLDAAIAARTAAWVPPAKDQMFGAHLAMTKDQMVALRSAFLAGDFKGATETLGKAIGDTTNFNKIIASGDVTDLLATMMDWFGKDENSFRLLRSRSREATFAAAEDELRMLAEKHGTSADAIRQALEAQFPKRDLTKVLTAYRMLEVSLAQQSLSLAKAVKFGGEGATRAADELTRMLALTGIVNDRRAGLVSDIARALNSLQKAVEPVNMVLRAAANEARRMGYEEFIATRGGGMKNIQRLADMIVAADTPEGAAALVEKASTMLSGTLGDALYAFVIHNTLSGPLSAIKNLTSSAFYQGGWKPIDNMAGAFGRDMQAALTGQDVTAMRKELRRIRATYAAARKTLATDSIVRRNMRQAWETGQRVTTPGGAFMEHLGATGGKVTRLGEGNMARATELARTLRDGGTMKIPFGPRVKVGAAIFGQKRLNRMATALDASAQTRRLWSPLASDPNVEIAKRYGIAAKGVDYMGRVNSWAMHALATGDEWNSAIAKSAALEAETFEAVSKMGLRGAEADDYARSVIDNIHMLEDLQRKADDGLLTPSQLKRLEVMEEVSAKADDYVREVTFTEAPGVITQWVAHARAAIPGARWMLFFVRTPGNIAKAGIQNNPLSRGVMAFNEFAKGDTAAAAEQAGRMVSSGLLALAGYEAVTSGFMTGSGPSDPEANALWLSEEGGNNRPYTWRVPTPFGPIHVNYGSFIDPVGIPLQVMSDLVEAHEYMDEPTFTAFADEFRTRLMALMESKSYLGSIVDAMDAISGRTDFSKVMVRVGRNFVPQARMLASLRTNGLPVPAGVGKAIIGAQSEDDQLMSLQELIDGQSTKGLIDRGTGVKLDEKGNLVDIHGGIIDSPMVVNFVSTVAEDMPEFVAEPWLELHAKILGVRAQHGKFVQRDQLGEKRHLPIGYGPQNAGGLLNSKASVRQELIDVGMDKSVTETFGQFMGQELTPEQQDFYQRRYRRPKKKMETAEEMFAKAIESDGYKKLGDTVGNIKGAKYKMLNAIHEARLAQAQAMLMEEFPELRAVFMQSVQQRAQMMSKEGSDAFAAERAANAPALLRAFEEALNGGN